MLRHVRDRGGRAGGGRGGRERDDDHQHGAPAPQHPRRAAPHAGALGRDRAPDQADHRLPAHRHGEDRRAAQLPPGPDQRHPHGLRRAAVQRAGVLNGHRAAPRGRAAAARHLDPDAHVRAQPGGVTPAFPGHQRHGHRGDLDDALRLAGARGGAAGPREDHRAADEPQLHPTRWRGRRPPRRVGGGRGAPPRDHPAPPRRVRRPAHRPAHLAGAPPGRRGHHHRRGDRARRHRPDPALDRLRLGPPAGHALPGLRRGGVRRDRRDLRRLLRPVRHPAERDPRVAADPRPDRREDAPGRLPGAGPEGHPAAPGPHRRVDGGLDPPLQDLHRGLPGAVRRDLRRPSSPPRRAGLLPRERRHGQAVPDARPGPQLREPPGPPPHDAQRPHRRRRGRHQLASIPSWEKSIGEPRSHPRASIAPGRSSIATRWPGRP